MSHDYGQMKIRLPPELSQWLKKRAKEGYRPINSEVVMILQNEKKKDEATEKKELEENG